MVFNVDGLGIYISNVASRREALAVAMCCKWLLHPSNLIQVERLPSGIKVYSIEDYPKFEPSATFAVRGLRMEE